MKVKLLYFFNNGNIICFDKNGNQVVPEQKDNLFVKKLKDMIRRKVIDKNTLVSFQFSDGQNKPLYECEFNLKNKYK